jgi:hypothetical protein
MAEEMSFPNMPTEQQISVLCDIASSRGADLPPDRLLDLMDFIPCLID